MAPKIRYRRLPGDPPPKRKRPGKRERRKQDREKKEAFIASFMHDLIHHPGVAKATLNQIHYCWPPVYRLRVVVHAEALGNIGTHKPQLYVDEVIFASEVNANEHNAADIRLAEIFAHLNAKRRCPRRTSRFLPSWVVKDEKRFHRAVPIIDDGKCNFTNRAPPDPNIPKVFRVFKSSKFH